MENSMTHLYLPRADQREKNLFREEYFSGTDTDIYFNGEEQKEIASIAYSVQEQLLPIYGYNSRTFDTVAIGNRVVTGEFTVTIRNPDAHTPLSEIKQVLSGSGGSYTTGNYEYNESQRQNITGKDWYNTPKVEDVNQNGVSGVRDIVLMLEKLGYGIDTYETIPNAIRAYQEDSKILAVTGIIDDPTRASISLKYAKMKEKEASDNDGSADYYSGATQDYYNETESAEQETLKPWVSVFSSPELNEWNLIHDAETEEPMTYEVLDYVDSTPYGDLTTRWKKVKLENGAEGYIYTGMEEPITINENVPLYKSDSETLNNVAMIVTEPNFQCYVTWIKKNSRGDTWYCLRREGYVGDLWIKYGPNKYSFG